MFLMNFGTVLNCIPPYFDNAEQPIISYSYGEQYRTLIFFLNYTSIQYIRHLR